MRSIPFTSFSLGAVALLGVVGCSSGGEATSSTGSTASGTSGAGGASTSSTGASTDASSGVSTGAGGGGGAMVGPPIPMGTPLYYLQSGVKTVIGPGSQAGFGITGNGTGGYTLVWSGNTTGNNPAVKFEGSVWTPGKFTDFVPGCADKSCTLEADDLVGPPEDAMGGGQYIGISATSTNDLDGFDFSVDKDPVYFDLVYNSQRLNARVVYPDANNGGSLANPQKIPFGMATP